MKKRVLAVLACAMVACSSPNEAARVDANVGDKTTFLPVASALGHRCGSLDCHGSLYRNFRIYGYGGLRLQPGDSPDQPDATTRAESDATYDALVGLEPELTRRVLLAGGGGADELTVVRKGRGEEHHEGGRLMSRDDDADACLIGWLSGAPNADACDRVVKAP